MTSFCAVTRRVQGISVGRAASFLLLGVAVLAASGDAKDPLAAEIVRLSESLKADTATDDLSKSVKDSAGPSLAIAQQALAKDRRLLALYRAGHANINLTGLAYVHSVPPAASADTAGFDAEWARMGKVLAPSLAPLKADALAQVRPAGVRAMGEAAMPQVRGYYEASLEYGHNTMPQYGLLYIGSATAQRDFIGLTRKLSEPTTKKAPPLRSLSSEIEALQAELLAAYKPPASIDRHPDFIGASSSLNDARQLDAAGLRYGAMMRYLQAELRLATLKTTRPPIDAERVPERLAEIDRQLASSDVDHSIVRYFLEAAQNEIDSGAPASGPPIAAWVATDVIPLYFAALKPAKAAAAKPKAEVTVTLVRWPYT
jgi:hypothetical protein